MPLKSFTAIVTNFLGRVPLRVVLVLPFVVQVVATVGTVSYLSRQSGQRTIDSLADQLTSEVSRRIEQNLQAYLATPDFINGNNTNLVRSQLLNLQNLQQWDSQLLYQVQRFQPTVLYAGVGTVAGEYRSAEQLDATNWRINIANEKSGFRSYAVDASGRRLGLKTVVPNFQLRQRPEYQRIAQAKTPVWTPLFTSVLEPSLLIAKAEPIFSAQQQFQGFVITAIRLDQIGRFLSSLEVSQTGQAFVMDRQGHLLATSTSETVYRDHNGKRQPIQAIDSSNPLTRDTATYLARSGTSLTAIAKLYQHKASFSHGGYYLSVLPLSDPSDLDWLIVVVIPEVDLMNQIYRNHQITLFLSFASVLISVGLIILAAHWVTKPLMKLNEAAKRIADGDLHQEIDIHRQDEVGQLSHSFNRMSQQLQRSFEEMEDLNQELEARKNQLAHYRRTMEKQPPARTDALERATRELVRLATTDSLTQLSNRRRFDDYLHQQWVHAIRSQSHLSLILCDVDYFKRYNDYYGHQMGDDCLQQVAHAIRSALQRSTDLAARYGGEEFGIVLPYSDLPGATLVARAIQAQILQLKHPHAHSEVSPFITLSLGIAHVIPQRSLTFEQLIAAADAALYEAKMQGRNCYCVRELLPPPPVPPPTDPH